MGTATEQGGSTVFISYARANEARVRLVADRLRGLGYTVWIDQMDIEPGTDWRTSIEEAVAGADFLVMAVSKSSTRSEMVEWELALAERVGTRVLPIVFSKGDVDSEVVRRLESLHHISFAKGNERGMAALVEALGGIRKDVPVLPGEVEFPAIGQNARMIAEIVRFLQQFSHTGGAAILTGGHDWKHYVQFLVVASEAEVFGEAVGNANLEGGAELEHDQLAALKALGWEPPTRKSHGNHTRTWYADSERGRALIAGDVMRTFLDVYRHYRGERLQLELQVKD